MSKCQNDRPFSAAFGTERRLGERRQQDVDRRGILRWDPQMKERRIKDRRQSGPAARGH